MKHEKILDRIRKLLAMAGDTSSPNEAAIAAKRARSLMDKYQIEEMDLTSVEDDDFGTSTYESDTKTKSSFMATLSIAVARLNDCQVRYKRNPVTRHLDLRFEGLLIDAVCAAEMLKWLRDAAYKQSKRENGRADRHSYRMGFVHGVRDQVDDILEERAEIHVQATAAEAAAGTSGGSLMVIKQQLVKSHFGEAKYKSRSTTYSGSYSAYDSGEAAGREVSLNKQVGVNRKALA